MTPAAQPASAKPNAADRPTPSVLSILTELDPRYGGVANTAPALTRATNQAAGRPMNDLLGVVWADERFDGLDVGGTIHVHRRKWLRGYDELALIDRLRTLARSYDVLHVHGLWQAQTNAARIVAARQSKPFVMSLHGHLRPVAMQMKGIKKAVYFAAMERHSLEAAAGIRVLTSVEAQDVANLRLRTPARVIPNGVDLPRADFRDSAYSRFPLFKDRRVALVLGRIAPEKGLCQLVRAWHAAQPPSDWLLVMAGPDYRGYAAKVRAVIEKLGCGSSIEMIGPVYGQEKFGLIQLSSLFILNSITEALSGALLEAVGIGVPVAVSPAVWADGIDLEAVGWRLPEGQENEVLSAILRSPLREFEARRELGPPMVRKSYSWSEIGQQTLDWYGSLR